MIERVDDRSPGDSPFPEARVAAPGAPWRWLVLGFADMRAAPGASLFYGVVFALMGAALILAVGSAAVELALVTGFLLVAPFLSVGVYDLSRRRQQGEQPMLAPTLTAWKANAPALGFYALILALLLAVWIRVSVVVVALFFSSGAPMEQGVLAELASSLDGWIFMGAYAAAGGGFALLVFATSVVSIPMLLDRAEMDTITAMIASYTVLRRNFATMLLWAAIIVGLMAVGFFTYFIGLVVVAPLIGHATWHAYRDTVA
ncbi:MAG: DUF2189 domain-containing protein [Burkholderiales bacterium]|nr:DUF2189 domain-containing protein [Burkholderiales bacterium]